MPSLEWLQCRQDGLADNQGVYPVDFLIFTPNKKLEKISAICIPDITTTESTCTRPGYISKHCVAIGSLLWNRLYNIPVLNNLAVLQLENIHNGITGRTRLSHGMHMKNHVLAIGE